MAEAQEQQIAKEPTVAITVIPKGNKALSVDEVTNALVSEGLDGMKVTSLGGNSVQVVLPVDTTHSGGRETLAHTRAVLSGHGRYVKDIAYENQPLYRGTD